MPKRCDSGGGVAVSMSQYHRFQSLKILAHANRLRAIADGDAPYPIDWHIYPSNNCNHSGPYGKLCTSALRLLVVASTCYTSRVLAPIRSFLHDIRACGGGICTLCNSSVNQGRSSKSLSLRKVVASVFAYLLALSCPMPYAPWRTLGKEARICSPCVVRCA